MPPVVFTVRIPPEMHRDIKRKASGEGRPIQWIITRALQDWLEGKWEPTTKREE